MSSSWMDAVQEASYRGMKFKVTSDGMTIGRRVVCHEFPQRNTPYAEDMGKATREIKISAFVVGDNCYQQRNWVMAACEASGPGTLIHPTLGQMLCSCESCTVTESSDAGRVVQFEMVFVESGDATWPLEVTDAEDVVDIAADACDESAFADFEAAWDTANSIDTAIDDITDSVTDTEELLELYLGAETLGDALTSLDGLAAASTSLVATPDELAEDWRDVIQSIDDLTAIDALTGAYAANAAISTAAAAVAGLTPTQQEIADNRAALDRLLYLLSLAQSCRLASAEAWTVWDDAQVEADRLADWIDDASGTATHDMFVSLSDLRHGIVSGILDASAMLPRLVSHTPQEVTSTLELAQYLYRDVDRATEIGERNKVVHPGFVPARELKVLNV